MYTRLFGQRSICGFLSYINKAKSTIFLQSSWQKESPGREWLTFLLDAVDKTRSRNKFQNLLPTISMFCNFLLGIPSH